MLAYGSIKFVIGSFYCKWEWEVESKMICALIPQLCKKCMFEKNNGIKMKITELGWYTYG